MTTVHLVLTDPASIAAGDRFRQRSRTVVRHLMVLGGSSVRAAAAVTAAAYLAVHTAQESALFLRFAAFCRFGVRRAPPEPEPDPAFDVVDQASWESFPASDPPGYR